MRKPNQDNWPTLAKWDAWYQQAKPELFDLASFEIFIQTNASQLIASGALVFIRGQHYVVRPDFDRYVATSINCGLLRAILKGRRPLPVGAQ